VAVVSSLKQAVGKKDMSSVIHLYRQSQRAARQFLDYNFREYAIRRTREGYRSHMGETEAAKIKEFVSDAHRQLEVIRRCTMVARLYPTEQLVVQGMSGKQKGKGDIMRQTEEEGV